MRDAGSRERALADAIIALNSALELPAVLDAFLDAATGLTGAPYAAINVLDAQGRSQEFHSRGMPDAVAAIIGRPPEPIGVLGQIPREGTLAVHDVTTHPARTGLPPGHPPLTTFLGTSLRVGGRVFGQLYLANKADDFTEDDRHDVRALAAAASVAIDHAQLYELALARERWLAGAQRITTRLLSDDDADAGLQEVIDTALELSAASAAALVLPGVGDAWVLEVTAGEAAHRLLGLELPENGTAMSVIRDGEGMVAPEPPGPSVLDEIADYGPSLYAPLVAQGDTVGLLMLWRQRGGAEFGPSDLAVAQRFASQAAVALSMSELNHVKSVSSLLEERARLADDLHDFVSQELFATAMQIEAIAEDVSAAHAARLRSTLEHIKRAQHEVRGVMGALAGQRSLEPIDERLRRELLIARDMLGFRPSVTAQWPTLHDAVENDPTLADDLVAVTRELVSNVARHAHAGVVSIDLTAGDGRAQVRVQDDGVGPAGAMRRHSGTSNLANRALRRNGTFSLDEATPGAERPGCIAVWNVEALV
ncbi:GAF domain-containing protein [Demequina sp. NBRC 110053]|uniref:sensor histidine kinase n=1 Tax=Demequina sp. NBRC 110053 TaxID=1570342 RepID=UPI000A0564FD|nr:GAF domain-containing protein [Demequina sp. NBRC 110053]